MSLSNENIRSKMMGEDVENVTNLLYKALRGHRAPITVDSFKVIFPEKRHRCEVFPFSLCFLSFIF